MPTFHKISQEQLAPLIEKSLLTITKQSPILFWLVSIDWKQVLYVSPAFEKMYGYPVDQIYKNAELWYNCIHPDDRDRVLTFYDENHAKQTVLEYRIIRSDDHTIWIRDITCPIHNEHGELIMLAGLAEDITERKHFEDQLKKSEERYRSFVQNFQGIAYRTGMDYIPIFFHGAVNKITGFTENEFLKGKPRWD